MAEELVQDLFVYLWEKKPIFHYIPPLKPTYILPPKIKA